EEVADIAEGMDLDNIGETFPEEPGSPDDAAQIELEATLSFSTIDPVVEMPHLHEPSDEPGPTEPPAESDIVEEDDAPRGDDAPAGDEEPRGRGRRRGRGRGRGGRGRGKRGPDDKPASPETGAPSAEHPPT